MNGYNSLDVGAVRKRRFLGCGKMKKACQYAIVQFMPHPETGEFANVGVIVLCPEERFFDFRLLKKYARVTRFFEQMDNNIYIGGKKCFHDELLRIKQMIVQALKTNEQAIQQQAIRLFADLTREREAVFRFDKPAVLLADNGIAALERLYNFYVEREFVTKEYQERLMESAVRKILLDADVASKFKGRDIGDELYHVRFPFVAGENGKETKIIKPLALDQGEPVKIYAHADHWLPKIRRLRERHLLPKDVLFTVTAPPVNDEKCKQAYNEVCDELISLDVQVVAVEDKQKILTFAKS